MNLDEESTKFADWWDTTDDHPYSGKDRAWQGWQAALKGDDEESDIRMLIRTAPVWLSLIAVGILIGFCLGVAWYARQHDLPL